MKTQSGLKMDWKRLVLSFCLILTGCAGHKKVQKPAVVTQTPEIKGPVEHYSGERQSILNLARREWEYFGKQVVVLTDDEESIPHVGHWEDDGSAYSGRVNNYWRSVGKPQLDGMDCKEPWSAAFVSWVMQEAGLPRFQFPGSDAHRNYLMRISSDSSGAFKARSIKGYSPRPGDLICAVRDTGGALPYPGEDFRVVLETHNKLHCDIVVANDGKSLEAIGGNVRNSVSKTIVKLNSKGSIQPTERRPWFMVLENQL